jgi:Holliday junction resolvase-like predicted endonuclease
MRSGWRGWRPRSKNWWRSNVGMRSGWRGWRLLWSWWKQRRTEERLTRLEDAVQELVKVVQKHEERLETIEQILAKALIRMDRLESQVGQLANRLGLDLEVDAEEVLRSLLEDRGIRMLQEPFALEVDGEMDVVVPVELPTGERPWIIVEVKGRLRRKELGEFLQRLQRPSIQEELQRAGVQKPLPALCLRAAGICRCGPDG